MVDPVRRSAARTATLVAVPLALLVLAAILWSAGVFTPPPAAAPQATSPVSMAAPSLDAGTAQICALVVAKLPDAVRDAHRRPVSAGAEQNAAYGDPPITLACGTAAPSLAPTTDVYPLSGVCWVAQATPNGAVWTTVDRTVVVTVTVPGAPDGSGQSVVPFSPAIAADDPRQSAPPPGCG